VAGLGAYSQGDVGAWCTSFADAALLAALEAERMAQWECAELLALVEGFERSASTP